MDSNEPLASSPSSNKDNLKGKARPVLQHPDRTFQIQPEKVLYFINFHELQFSQSLKKKNLEYVDPSTRVSTTIFTQMHDDSKTHQENISAKGKCIYPNLRQPLKTSGRRPPKKKKFF